MPGLTTSRSTPIVENSARRASLKPCIANFVAQYSLHRGIAAMAEDRADVHDDRLRPFAEHGQRFADEFGGGEEVHFKQLAQASSVGFIEAAQRADAGVVHQNVEATEQHSAGFQRGTASRWIDDVAGDELRLSAGDANFLAHLAQFLFAAREKHHPRALASQFHRDRAADAAGGAGDQRTRAGDVAMSHGTAPALYQPAV